MGQLKRNLLVISDLHLGEDVRPSGAGGYLRWIERLERELESFLAHYTRHRRDGRSWRLVVNGDMVDFMSVMILPRDGEEADDAPSEDERLFGLAHDERRTLHKLDRVGERHAGVFRHLAEFVAAGNELVIVVGNHDVEFVFPGVQRRFVELLGRLLAGGTAALGDRVSFCPWFYYEDDLVYVEHGHQYDAYCSFDYQLHPVESRGNVALSVSHAGIRYFTNMVPTINPRDAERWGGLDYLRWAWAHGAREAIRIFYVYGLMVWKLLEIWSRLTNRRADAERRAHHHEALRALAADYQIGVEKAEALDGLRQVPVLRGLGKILRAMFLDRVLLGAGTLVALAAVLIFTRGVHRPAGVAALLALAWATNWLLDRGRLIPSEAALRRVPEAIGRILRAPFIVFGHSHHPEAIGLPGGGTYFNTGAWAVEGRAAFTHLIIAGADQPEAGLFQWKDGASLPFAAAE